MSILQHMNCFSIEGVGSVAAVSSIGSAIDLLSDDDWKEKFVMIEVMACPGKMSSSD